MFAFKQLTLCLNVQELFPTLVPLLLALWALATKSLGSAGLWSLIIKAANIQLRRVKLEMNPAADGGVSSRGVVGTVEPRDTDTAELFTRVYIIKWEITQWALEITKETFL